jgi:hypothetical protein
LLTGTGDLLDELRFARATGKVDEERLEWSVGKTAARRLHLAPPVLEPGARADFVLLAAPLLRATAGDVQLVVAAGTPRVAAPRVARLLESAGLSGSPMTLAGIARWTNPQPCQSSGKQDVA